MTDRAGVDAARRLVPVLMAGMDRLRANGLGHVAAAAAADVEAVLRVAGFATRVVNPRRPPAVTNLDGAAAARATSSAVVADPLPLPGRVVPVEEAASRLGLSSRQVRRLAVTGRLAGRKVGTTWILDGNEVERVRLQRRRADAAAP